VALTSHGFMGLEMGLDLGWKNGLVMWASKCRLIKSRVTLANLSAEELEETNFCNRLDG